MAVKVVLPPQVIEEITAAGAYISKDNLSAALDLMDRIYARCQSLSALPERGSPYGEDYRRVFEGPYQIVYRVDANETDEITVVIVAVHHMSRRPPVI